MGTADRVINNRRAFRISVQVNPARSPSPETLHNDVRWLVGRLFGITDTDLVQVSIGDFGQNVEYCPNRPSHEAPDVDIHIQTVKGDYRPATLEMAIATLLPGLFNNGRYSYVITVDTEVYVEVPRDD